MVILDGKADILSEIKKIENSPLSAREYFNQNTVPFSRSQYYIYRKTLNQFGENGLRDKRTDGNNTKLTSRVKDYIITVISDNREISSSQLQRKIQNMFGITVTESCLNSFRASISLTRVRPLPKKVCHHQKSGGGEILTALAFFSNIIDIYTQTIMERMDEIRESELFEKSKNISQDNIEYRQNGRFTSEYNQLPSVRENRFKSIDEKIVTKNLSTMNIFKMSEKTISRYNLALLCLPLVTSNGKSSRINRVKGNDLSFLCGENYKDATIERYLQELKYLKISDKLIDATAKFWQDFWRNEFGDETIFACYYIDGNTKPLWSSNRCYKGKVTMLGRVMNCLENVFIHDGKGHPLYFQTFHGHGDLGKHALNMLTKLTQLIDDPNVQASVKRILVFDGGGNGVSTLRSFGDSDQYYITILDDNQVTARKIKNIQESERYKYGESFLYESQIELEDSLEKGYIHECRAVSIDWDNGKRTVLITNIPCEFLDASELTKKYFDRWPQQEKQFREAKSGVNIHRIVGYGMKVENYERMSEKHAKLCETISFLRAKLEKPLKEIDLINEKLPSLFAQEKILHEISQIINGKRILSDEDSTELQMCITEINRLNRQLNSIKKDYKEDFKRYYKSLKEERRIRDKDTVYKIDLELDQIMTCFKMSFVNLCSLFLTKCMKSDKFELSTLFESVFQLEGYSDIEKEKKNIKLEMNPKEPDMIDKISNALQILNGLNLRDLNGRAVRFIV
jgi:AraC-like DNA-binding protein